MKRLIPINIILVLFLTVSLGASIKTIQELQEENSLINISREVLHLDLLEANKKLVKKEQQISSLRENAAKLASVSSLSNYFSEEEIEQLVSEIPTGSPFPGGYIVTAPYGKSVGYNGSYRNDHEGIDLGPADGDWQIHPYSAGIVTDYDEDHVYGKYLYVQHTDRVRSFYAHAAKIFYRATTGNNVELSTTMMIMGETGQADGPHLHFEIQILTADGWKKIDPTPFLE